MPTLPESPTGTDSRNVLFSSGALNPTHAVTELHLADGRILRLATALLESAADLTEPAARGTDDETVIPLIEERLDIGKRTVTTGIVRLHKVAQEFETALDEPLAVHTYDMERIVLNQPVDTAPPVRTEGDTTIYPLVEEQLVLTKQLLLKEEVRVTRRESVRRDTQTVVLRREHLIVEREPLK